MNTKEAIEFCEQIKYSNVYTPQKFSSEIGNIQNLLQRNQELVTKFSKEGEEYQKSLDQIDLWAMEIQELVEKIRGKI